MSKTGPIVLVEDDEDDMIVFRDVIHELGVNKELVWFADCQEAMKYLTTSKVQPFIIFSDVNLPRLSGIEFKRNIDSDPDLRRRSIPFVFYSTSADQVYVNEAYTKMTVQGFFQKPSKYNEIKDLLRVIIEYWASCKHPNIF